MTTVGIARPHTRAFASAHAPAATSSWGRLLRVEARKLVDTRSGFWLVVSGLLLVVAMMATMLVVSLELAKRGAGLPFSWQTATTSVGSALGVFLAILAILSITSEWTQRSALTTFALEPRRGRVLVAKVAVLSAITVALTAFSALLGALVVALAPQLGGQSTWDFTLAQAGGFLGSMMLTTLLGVAFALALLSSAAALAAYFVMPMIGAIIQGLGAVWEPLRPVIPWVISNVSMSALSEGQLTSELPWQLLTSSLLWIGLPAAIGTWRWLRRQVV